MWVRDVMQDSENEDRANTIAIQIDLRAAYPLIDNNGLGIEAYVSHSLHLARA